MAMYDKEKYATVAERMVLLKKKHPDYRLLTEDYSTPQDRAAGIWRVKAMLYLNAEDQTLGLIKSTGHAYELDSAVGPQKTSGLEVGETSAIGRCLMVAGFAASKDPNVLASAEEMEKVARGKGAADSKNKAKLDPIMATQNQYEWLEARVAGVKNKTELNTMWEAVSNDGHGQLGWVRDLFQKRGDELK